jgi:hypothetical protein
MAGGRKDGGNCLPKALKAHPPEVLSARSRSILQIYETRTKQSRNRTSNGAFPAGTQSALAIEGGTNRAIDLVLREAELNTKTDQNEEKEHTNEEDRYVEANFQGHR